MSEPSEAAHTPSAYASAYGAILMKAPLHRLRRSRALTQREVIDRGFAAHFIEAAVRQHAPGIEVEDAS